MGVKITFRIIKTQQIYVAQNFQKQTTQNKDNQN